MSYTIIDRLKFLNSQQDNLKEQERLRQIKYQNDTKPSDSNHILSCSMTDALAKVRKDNRTLETTDYLRPDIRYRK